MLYKILSKSYTVLPSTIFMLFRYRGEKLNERISPRIFRIIIKNGQICALSVLVSNR